jgi:hypothetical protein
MANLFDATNAPETEPIEIVAGGYYLWKRTDLGTDYPNTAYTLTYKARIAGGGFPNISLTATASGDNYLVTITSTASAQFVVGDYKWQSLLGEGEWKVVSDVGASTADFRTHAAIMVAKIESLLIGKADADVANYSIAGRSLTKLSMSELIEARDMFKAEVVKEQAEDRIKRGQKSQSTVFVRF